MSIAKSNGKTKKFICTFFAVLLLILPMSNTFSEMAYANSWTENVDNSIYEGTVTNDSPGFMEEIVNDMTDRGVGLVEGYLRDLLVSLTDGLYIILDYIGITVDSVIYGRVGGNARDGIAYFTFELEKGNPYGVVGAIIYRIIAGIAIVYLAVILFGKFSLSTFMDANSKNRSEFKSFISTGILAIAMMILMPYFLDIALYLRDITLSIVSNEGSRELFNNAEGISLVEHFRNGAVKEESGIVDGAMYLSTVLLSLYLAAVYVGYAMSFLVCFISFPIISTAMNVDKKLMSQWTKQVFSILITPVMDCVLFMVPLFIGYLPNSAKLSVLRIFLCAMVVPARNVIRQLLGLGSTGLDLAGVATMMGAARLAGAAGRAVSNYREGKRGAASDNNMADYYQEMANNENSEGSGSVGNSSGIGAGPGIGAESGGVSPSSSGGAASTGDTSYMGKGTDPIFAKYADTQNFDNLAFKGKLSNQQMSDMYRQRAVDRKAKANSAALGSLAGGFAGLGGSMFMSPGTATTMGAIGMNAGGMFGTELSKGDAIHKLQSQPNISQSNMPEVEVLQGDIDDISGLVNYQKVASEVVNDNTPSNYDGFMQVNREAANATASSLVASYCFNNGEKLKDIYSEVNNKNNGSGKTNAEIRKQFIDVANDRICSEFIDNFKKNEYVTFSGNDKVDIPGMEEFRKGLGMHLQDSGGILSDVFINTYNWMPKEEVL